MGVLCSECEVAEGTWPWAKARRICVPCLEAVDRPPPPERAWPRCAYCGHTDDLRPCCEKHPKTDMCSLCRRALWGKNVGRPEWHRSPVEKG
jgi:hypothetical protein